MSENPLFELFQKTDTEVLELSKLLEGSKYQVEDVHRMGEFLVVTVKK